MDEQETPTYIGSIFDLVQDECRLRVEAMPRVTVTEKCYTTPECLQRLSYKRSYATVFFLCYRQGRVLPQPNLILTNIQDNWARCVMSLVNLYNFFDLSILYQVAFLEKMRRGIY